MISGSPDLEKELKVWFPGKNAAIHVILPDKFAEPPPFAPPEFEEIHKMMNVENALELIVDDDEMLMVPPFISGSVSALSTKNKGAILQMKIFSQFNWKRLIEGVEFPCPPGPDRKKK